MLTLQEYIEKEKNKIYEQFLREYARSVIDPHFSMSKRERKRHVSEYILTDECKKGAIPYMENKKRYQAFFSDDAEHDQKVLDSYHNYVKRTEAEKAEEYKQKLQKQKINPYFSYIKRNSGIIIEHINDILDYYIKEIKTAVESKDIKAIRTNYFYYNSDNTGDKIIKRSVHFCEKRFKSIKNNKLLKEIEKCLKENDDERYMSIQKEIKEDISDEEYKIFRELVEEQFPKYLKTNMSAVYKAIMKVCSEIFTTEYVTKLLLKNNRYKKIVSEYLEEKKLAEETQSTILKRIPENPIDLYPSARKMNRMFYLHIGPTNSGKTYNAIQALEQAEKGVYLGPLRLLAFECFEKLNNDGILCNLITGEEEFMVDKAKHTSSTIELFNKTAKYDVAVIDEAQMIADKQRGGSWSAAILGVLAKEIHICAAPEAENILTELIEMCGDDYEIIRHERMTPLEADNANINTEKFEESVQKHDALIVFSKRKVLACASDLQKRGISCSIIYGALPYEVRQNEAKRFANGETDVVVATDAIGMGMNLPIKRVFFLEQEKYDGENIRRLYPNEIRQIAGRAGRKGIFDYGTYTSLSGTKWMRKAVNGESPQIKEAQLGFEKSLIWINGDVSYIMKQWQKMEMSGVFGKTDLKEQIQLAEELERLSDDKELIYEFAIMPFDTDKTQLYTTWKKCFLAEQNGEHVDFEKPNPDDVLEELEDAYEYCDLMYYYHRHFTRKRQFKKILECKKELAERINKILKEEKLPYRKCKACGKHLPWNYPYGYCNKCYSSLFGHRGYWY